MKSRQLARSGSALAPRLVRAILDSATDTDSLMESLEARVAAPEEVAAARGIQRLALGARLRKSLRASVRPFAGRSFAERRCEAASAEWLSATQSSELSAADHRAMPGE